MPVTLAAPDRRPGQVRVLESGLWRPTSRAPDRHCVEYRGRQTATVAQSLPREGKQDRFWPVETGPPPRTPAIRGVGNVAASGSRPAASLASSLAGIPSAQLERPSANPGRRPHTCQTTADLLGVDERRNNPMDVYGSVQDHVRPGLRSSPTWPPHRAGAPVRHRPGPVGRQGVASQAARVGRRPYSKQAIVGVQAAARLPARKGRLPPPVPSPPALATGSSPAGGGGGGPRRGGPTRGRRVGPLPN